MKKLFISLGLLLLSLSVSAQTFSEELVKKAQQGDAAAKSDLGVCYYNGLGTKVDNAKAFELFVSTYDNPQSLYYLGTMIEEGKYDPNFDKGGIYSAFKNQIEQEDVFSNVMSPDFFTYLQSCSNPTDVKVSTFLYLLAAGNGNKEAARKLNKFLKEKDDTSANVQSESGHASLSLTAKLEKPNSILSVISPDKLKDIDSLTVIGYMYETDVKVLGDCKRLRYLNLSRAYITYSPEEKKNIQQRQEAFKALFSFMGVAADAKYLDGNMSTMDYAFAKGFSRLVSESPDKITKADNGCIIPTRSFQNMGCLETVILPYRTYKIESHSFKYCSSLRNVVLPKHLKIIGQGCFHGCKSLQNIDIPASVKSIGIADMGTGVLDGEGSFTDTGLTKLDLSKCVFDEATGPGGLVKWSFIARDNEALKDIRIPQGATFVQLMLHHTQNFSLHFPASVNTIFMRYIEGNNTYHFKSMTPPRFTEGEIRNATVYVPKGATTAYYAAYGNTNKYVEE